MVAFARRHAIRSFFENRVFAVPESKTENQKLVAVADCGQAVLAPAICLAPRHIMGNKLPGVSVRAVIFPHRSPGALADVRAPPPPEERLSLCFDEPPAFCCLTQ